MIGDIMKRKLCLILLIILSTFMFVGCSNNESKKLVENKDYFIVGEFTGKYLDLTKRGYYIDTLNQIDAPYFYIICMGERSTGGYSLKIKEVNKVDDVTEIIVEEFEPKEGSVVTMAFTYPTVMIEFPEYQDNIVIKNTKGEEFKYLDA
jgi:thioredoxin-related protein